MVSPKASNVWKGLRMRVKLTTHSEQTGLGEVLPFTSTLSIKLSWSHQEIESSIKAKKSRNTTSNEMVHIAKHIWHWSLAREFSGDSKEIIGIE